MLSPDEITAAAARKWPNVLRAEAAGENLFPLGIPFGRPRSSDDFVVLRREIEALAAARHSWRIDWEEIETRRWGRQRLPARIEFDSIENMADTIGRSAELTAFREALREARQRCPALEPWLRSKAPRIVDHLQPWPSLIAVCAYFDAHPRPCCYPRQVPVPVGTKFIEEHAGILRELLDTVLGQRANASAMDFCRRFHLLVEPPRVRFRFLDSALSKDNNWSVLDCTIPATDFAALEWSIPRVLIVENRDVFLCLPSTRKCLAVFGAGKALTLLSRCVWLKNSDVVYWGDCDDAGYGILSSFRATAPQMRSVLMDELAWRQWKHLAVPGRRDLSVEHSRLTGAEKVAWAEVIAGPWMLEQERIPPSAAEKAIKDIFGEE